MARAEWGSAPEFFGPRHAYRGDLILDALGPRAESGLHLECAAGVGSLAIRLAGTGRRVVAADASLRSLEVLGHRAQSADGKRPLAVAADITNLPFADHTFVSATSAETLEHIHHDRRAAEELTRVLAPGGRLAGTVPAGPKQWSAWDDWAGHLRRYTRLELWSLLRSAGLQPRVRYWGWPVVRMYDGLFLRRVNRRRHRGGSVEDDARLQSVQELGRRRWLVRAVRAAFSLEKVLPSCRWGVGLVFAAEKAPVDRLAAPDDAPEASDPTRR